VRTAQVAGDTPHANAFNRVAEQLAKGVAPLLGCGDLLVSLKANDGTVYCVTALGCSCTASVNGRFCWHAAVCEGVALV
jgi:hypothetical protein